MRVAVIGSSGAMGSFFVRYFLSKGDDVVGSDLRRRRQEGMALARSDSEAVKGADVVLVATPIETTAAICRRLSAGMRRGSLLVEISSVKGRTPAQVRKLLEKRGVRFLSVHPLFGPNLQKYKGMRMAVVKDARDNSMADAKRVFAEARLFPMTAEVHDTLMSVMLSLTHLVGMAYAQVVSETIDPRVFREMATPSSLLQLTLAEGMLSQDPALYSSIQFANKFTTETVRRMAFELLKINELLARGDEKGFRSQFKNLAKAFSADESSMKRVYKAFEMLSS